MAPDDRDRSFEKALARHLRYSAPAGGEVEQLGSSSLPCPDAEILAAYHDGSLTSDERTLWKQHVLSCESCQVVLEHLATPLAGSVQSNEAESTAPVLAGRMAAAPLPVGTEVPARAAAPVAIVRPARRRIQLGWLIPAGAIAAGLVAYIALPPTKPIEVPQAPPLEVAKNEEPPAAPAEQTGPPVAKPVPENSRDAAKGHGQNALARRDYDAASRAARGKEVGGRTAQFQKAPRASHDTALSALLDSGGVREADKKKAAAGDATTAEKQKEANGKVEAIQAEMRKQGVSRQSSQPVAVGGEAGYLADKSVALPPPTAPPPPAAVVGGAPAAAPPKPVESKDSREEASNSAISALTESAEVSNQLESTGRMRTAFLQNPRVFAAPGAKILWRVGAAGSIERSTNKGKDWTPQVSGVLTDLLAGSAPSAKVSWIVGSGGTILRTIDAGAHWSKINSPAPGELAGIRATDALHAYVWFAPNPSTGLAPSFQTNDGGSTWIAVPTP